MKGKSADGDTRRRDGKSRGGGAPRPGASRRDIDCSDGATTPRWAGRGRGRGHGPVDEERSTPPRPDRTL